MTWKIASRMSVMMADIASEPRHPRRFEKKTNILTDLQPL
jgi:hypothetical protein